MALSQVQCLDNHHINLRTTESKPEFLYSEGQRLALETLLKAGQDAFEDYLKTNNIRAFLSDLELERILNNVEAFSPGSLDNSSDGYGESEEGALSLQYWPQRSDRSTPRLDIGWPDRASYRGVTRVQVYTQPPYEGQPHIKEVVRKMISQAQRVIAIVMDLFTDIDIFKDLLDASYSRKVAVYIILETTGVKHFMSMCENAVMHAGHLKNLRVRCIRGSQFFSRSSKRVFGSQNQKFMFIDGDKSVAGSYSFTWSASRLDRNLITVLSGQVVETFETLFQDMYVVSNGVCLSKMHLSTEPEPEELPQVVPTLLLSPTDALKLNNPKYTLVSNCEFNTNRRVSDPINANNSTSNNQNEVLKQIKETEVLSNIHPGLLNLQKANMINYIPTWPDPEPQSDVIGFINVRDSSKPMQAHLTRSELFESSQAIRFKNLFLETKEYLSPSQTDSSKPTSQAQPDPESQTPAEECKYSDQNKMLQHHQTSEDLLSHSEKQDTVHVLPCKEESKEEPSVTEKDFEEDVSKPCQSTKALSDVVLSASQDGTISDKKLIPKSLLPLQNLKLETTEILEEKSRKVPDMIMLNESLRSSLIYGDVYKTTKPETNQNSPNCTVMSSCDSSSCSLSDEYYECSSPVADLISEEVALDKAPEYLQNSVIQQKDIILSSSLTQDCIYFDHNVYTPQLLKTSCSTILNVLAEELNTSTLDTSFDQEREKTATNECLGNADENCPLSQNSNGYQNLSSTSEEYFECSETLGLKSEIESMLLSPSPIKHNKPPQQQNLLLEAEKLTELCCHNMKRDYETLHSGMELDLMADYVGTDLEDLEDFQNHEKNKSEVTSDQVLDHHQLLSGALKGCETRGSSTSLEVKNKADFEEKMAIEDLKSERTHLCNYLKTNASVHLMYKNKSGIAQINKSNQCCVNCALGEQSVELQSEIKPDLNFRHSEENVVSHLGTESKSRSVVVLDEEKRVVNNSRNTLTDSDFGSKKHHGLRADDYENNQHNCEVTPVTIKSNSEVDNHQEQFESTELLTTEDSGFLETNQNLADPLRSKGEQPKKIQLSKVESISAKSEKNKEKKLRKQVHDLTLKNACDQTAQLVRKQEGERNYRIQMNKNLPEARPKIECLARKQPYQATCRIPIQRRRLTKIHVTKPDHCHNFFGLRTPKDGIHKHIGKPMGQKNFGIALSPSIEKSYNRGNTPLRTTKIPQRSTLTKTPTKHPQKLHPDPASQMLLGNVCFESNC